MIDREEISVVHVIVCLKDFSPNSWAAIKVPVTLDFPCCLSYIYICQRLNVLNSIVLSINGAVRIKRTIKE